MGQYKKVFFDRAKTGPNSTLSAIWSPDEDELELFGLERAWLHDRSDTSCIAAGVYAMLPWTSPTFGEVWAFVGGSVTPFKDGVPENAGRWGNLLHAANRWTDLNGCVAPGFTWGRQDGGDLWVPPPSKKALQAFRDIMGYEPLVAYVRWRVGD